MTLGAFFFFKFDLSLGYLVKPCPPPDIPPPIKPNNNNKTQNKTEYCCKEKKSQNSVKLLSASPTPSTIAILLLLSPGNAPDLDVPLLEVIMRPQIS